MSSKKKRKSKNLSSPMNIFIFSILFVLAYRLVKHYLDDKDYDRKKDEKKNETVEEVKNEVKDKIPIGVYISVIVLLFVIIILLSFRSKHKSNPSDDNDDNDDNNVVLGSVAYYRNDDNDDNDDEVLDSTDINNSKSSFSSQKQYTDTNKKEKIYNPTK